MAENLSVEWWITFHSCLFGHRKFENDKLRFRKREWHRRERTWNTRSFSPDGLELIESKQKLSRKKLPKILSFQSIQTDLILVLIKSTEPKIKLRNGIRKCSSNFKQLTRRTPRNRMKPQERNFMKSTKHSNNDASLKLIINQFKCRMNRSF